MTKEIFISSTPHETRLAIVEDEQLVEIHYERENEYTLAGSMYKGKVTRVLPGMQSAFVDVGLERDAFLYVTDFLEEQDDTGEFERTALPAGDRAPRKASTEEHAPSETAGAESGAATSEGDATEEGGSRRFRGRRGRRRGGRERGTGEAAAARPESQPAESRAATGQTIEINSDSDDFGEASFEAHEAPQYDAPPPYDSAPEEPSDDWHAPMAAGLTESFAAEAEEPEPEAPRPARRGRGESAAPAFVLPGESLSKYSGGGRAETASKSFAPIRTPSAKPSTMIEAPITWDGGVTLPGETLSKHRGRKTEVAPPVHQQATSHRAPVDEILSEDDLVEESEAIVHEEAHSQAHEAPLAIDEHVFAEEEVQSEEELRNASASHKVDPNPPSEFRLPWSKSKSTAEEEHDPHTGSSPQDAARRKQAHEQAHEFASKSETSVEVFPGVPDFVEDESEHAAHHHNFSPGDGGQVEEETIDEDEYDFEPLRGQGDEHDSEDLVEETMEGSEISELVRDTYVNERTSFVYDSEDDADETDEDALGESAEVGEGEPAVARAAGATEAAPRQRRGRRGRRGQSRSDQPRGERQVATESPREERAPERDRSSDRSQDRRGGRRGGPGGNRRQSAQTMSLPAITELLKPGQEILVQIAKEPIAKKGARITSHIALPGRFLVYMPTVNHIGV
jgi:ribonuclease G